MKNYKLLWNKILTDLNNDDIVLEIKILKTNIQDWNNLLNIIYTDFYNIIDYDNICGKTCVLDIDDFSKTENDIMKYMVLDFSFFKLTLSLYTIEVIEFFSDSVVVLKTDNVKPLFLFCETISNRISRNIYVYCEGYNQYSIFYNPSAKAWELCTGK